MSYFSHIFEVDLAPLVTIGAVLGFISIYFARLRARARRRISQLKTASELLDDHFNALREFVEHPDSPPKLKEKLLIFSRRVADKAAFLTLLEKICSDSGKARNSSEAKVYEKLLTQLKAQNEDLSRKFATAVSSIVVAMILRHRDASELFEASIEASMAKMIVDPRNEYALFAGALKADRKSGEESRFGVQAVLV